MSTTDNNNSMEAIYEISSKQTAFTKKGINTIAIENVKNAVKIQQEADKKNKE